MIDTAVAFFYEVLSVKKFFGELLGCLDFRISLSLFQSVFWKNYIEDFASCVLLFNKLQNMTVTWIAMSDFLD